MIHYLMAEHLKCKRTFAKKLIVLAPFCVIGLVYLIGGMYFSYNGYNWWYILIVPTLISLMAIFMERLESKNLHYKGIFLLPISHKKTWQAKVIILCIYFTCANMLHFLGIALISLTLRTTNALPILNMFLSSLVISVSNFWLIPFSLFLAKKIGMIGTLFVNVALGTILMIFFADKAYWWACPYAYATRLMCPILHILPSGMLADSDSALLNGNVILIGILLSLFLFAILWMATASWFERWEEVK